MLNLDVDTASCLDFDHANLVIGEAEIHIWLTALERSQAEVHDLGQTLNADERDRAERFHFPRDRDRFIVSRALLRALLGRYLSCGPETLRFHHGPNGKPALAADSDDARIRFNLTHCDDIAVYAVSSGRELGVDVERIRPNLPVTEMAEHYFSAWEAATLEALPPADRYESFFRCWTRKEAYVKATGRGLSVPLDQFHVSLVPGEPAALLLHHTDPMETARWSLQDLPLPPGYAGAVAVEGNGWKLRCGRGLGDQRHKKLGRNFPSMLAHQAALAAGCLP
jgi:4'-phosphopantetheinyl transferase